MDTYLRKRLDRNTANFKRSLDRIADKYSKLGDEDEVLEVDIDKIELKTLSKYLTQSKERLVHSGSKVFSPPSQPDLTHHSVCSCATEHSQLSLSCKDDGADDEGTASSAFASDDNAEGSPRSLDESWRNPSEGEVLPEDRDEDLQVSLSSQSSSLAELYPMMVSRIERAWHRQTVSAAASSVLRRYRRWRRNQPRRSLDNTYDMAARPDDNHPKQMSGNRFLGEGDHSLAKRMMTVMTPRPVPSTLGSLPNGKQSPVKERRLVSGASPRLTSAGGFSDTPKPKEILLNETFFVSEVSPRKQTRRGDEISKSYLDLSFGARRPVSSNSSYAVETPSVPERPDIYGSPVRRSPFDARTTSTIHMSPLAFCRSPRGYDGVWSREPANPRSLSSPSNRPLVLLKKLYPPDSCPPPQPQLLLPQPTRAAESSRKFRRHLSFDSAPSRPVSHFQKHVDEDFVKLYHRFVCQGKSTGFNGLSCRLCGRSSEARGALFSTSLAALALSPHRSILRKRHGEQSCDSRPQAKRLRDETYSYSPGLEAPQERDAGTTLLSVRDGAASLRCFLQPQPSA